MAQPNRPQIRNIEHVRRVDKLQGEALDDIRTHLGNQQDTITALLERIAALEKKVG